MTMHNAIAYCDQSSDQSVRAHCIIGRSQWTKLYAVCVRVMKLWGIPTSICAIQMLSRYTSTTWLTLGWRQARVIHVGCKCGFNQGFWEFLGDAVYMTTGLRRRSMNWKWEKHWIHTLCLNFYKMWSVFQRRSDLDRDSKNYNLAKITEKYQPHGDPTSREFSGDP